MLGTKKRDRPSKILTKEFLLEHYVRLHKSTNLIAREFCIKSRHSVREALVKFNIPRKSASEARTGYRVLKNRKGYKDISGSYWYIIRDRAKRYNYEFNLDIKYIWNLYIKQNKKCRLSGLYIKFEDIITAKGKCDRTASLDRIDSNKGYIKGNVQWVHKDVNKMKQDLDENIFIKLCQMIAENTRG